MIIKNSRSLRSLTELSGKLFKADQYGECSGTAAIDLIIRNRPLFVSLKLKEPVNGDDDMMTMLSSVDVNTRLRVSVINTEWIIMVVVDVRQEFLILRGQAVPV